MILLRKNLNPGLAVPIIGHSDYYTTLVQMRIIEGLLESSSIGIEANEFSLLQFYSTLFYAAVLNCILSIFTKVFIKYIFS